MWPLGYWPVGYWTQGYWPDMSAVFTAPFPGPTQADTLPDSQGSTLLSSGERVALAQPAAEQSGALDASGETYAVTSGTYYRPV